MEFLLNGEIGNRDILMLHWRKPSACPTAEPNLILQLDENDFTLLNIGTPTAMGTWEAFDQGVETLDDIRDFIGYLIESEQARVTWLGSIENEQILAKLLPILKERVKSITDIFTLKSYLRELIERVQTYYELYKNIERLSFRTGDTLTVTPPNNRPMYQEKIICSDKGYLLTPVNWKIKITDDEFMTKEELSDFIFSLIVEEDCLVSYSSQGFGKKETVHLKGSNFSDVAV